MTTLAEFKNIADADNRPPMLEKSLYDSWKSRMELYIENIENGRMILNSILNGPLIWPTIKENGTIRTKKYEELLVPEKLQADCDLKATNIVLQGLPPDVYAIVNHHKVAKDIWDRGETLYQYYWRFNQLINNMNIINMSMRPVQVNTKFLNSLPPEWSKFMMDVKLARDLHTTNYDQLYSYLEQHEAHEDETRLMRERYQDPLAFVSNYNQPLSHLNNYHSQYNATQTVQNPVPQQPFNPPIRNDWDRLFQPMFDEYFNPLQSAVSLVLVAVAPRVVDITGVKEPIPKAHFDDPCHEPLHDVSTSQESSSNAQSSHSPLELIGKWTKDHPLANVIGNPSRPVSTRKQLETDAMWCYFDAFLTSAELKNFKEAMLESSWIKAMQE
ncbi:hypothetical protein Tco_0654345 [Tanacetum coccineum]|uniref:Integrase, catalytic region, zinc finger, CCHC-type, peptidase aspartic, catalytic n=1 Tax=Tanacetum coccineum TaxID=301880 RepID=A0ABQ4X2Y3_9ASTR